MVKTLAIICFVFTFSVAIGAQPRSKMQIDVAYIAEDIPLTDLLGSSPSEARSVTVETYWDGSKAPEARSFKATVFWSDKYFYALFDARQHEPLVVSESPTVNEKAMNLWDRDVCEIFLAPEPKEPRKYFEFEIAPNGEWLDVAIDLTTGERRSDWSYRSEMQSASKIEKGRVLMAVKIPWSAFGRKPKAGDEWLGNIFRCIGKDPDRGYLAWSPTMTKEPAFHVPERFGTLRFIR